MKNKWGHLQLPKGMLQGKVLNGKVWRLVGSENLNGELFDILYCDADKVYFKIKRTELVKKLHFYKQY